MKQILLSAALLMHLLSFGQGKWVPLKNLSPDFNNGVMLLLSDGTVMAKSSMGGIDTLGNRWNRLTPDAYGSYANGTWSQMDTMKYRRLYCSSQVLKDGRIYMAGGEYGNGTANAETYDPVTGMWKKTGPLPAGTKISDGNSEILPDGRVLQALVVGNTRMTAIYNPATDSFKYGATCIGSHNESSWVKLPDNSLLFVDLGSRRSERYLPGYEVWAEDDTLTVKLYDPYGLETGAAFLLPDGRAFFIGSPSTTAYYTPSGTVQPGKWAAGPAIPDSLGAPDAAAAMMPNGKILCALSRKPTFANHFPAPTWFYEFDYTTNTFTKIKAPGGDDTLHMSCYATAMLDLPDGNILYCSMFSNQYYLYIPDGKQLAQGKPVIQNIIKVSCDTYMAVGNGFNGISEGAVYGDDWQMATNYPIVRLATTRAQDSNRVYYARSFNWNSTGVMRGTQRDTTWFHLPQGLPEGRYKMEVVANGIHSDDYTFATCNAPPLFVYHYDVYPNPASRYVTIAFSVPQDGGYEVKLTDMLGRTVREAEGNAKLGENSCTIPTNDLPRGTYLMRFAQDDEAHVTKIVVQ